MIFVTVVAAIAAERAMRHFVDKLTKKPKRQLVKKEEPSSPMDVEDDDKMEVDYEAPQLQTLRKRLREAEAENAEMIRTQKIRDNAVREYKEQCDEKTASALSWEDFAQKVTTQLERAKQDKEDSVIERDNTLHRYNVLYEEKQRFLSERNEFEELYEEAKEKIEKLKKERNEQKDIIASSARQINNYQTREREARERNAQARNSQQLFEQAEASNEELKRKLAKAESDLARMRELRDQYGHDIQDLRQRLDETRAPAKIYLTRSGTCYHEATCNHLKHGQEDRPRSEFKRCKDCLG